MRVTRLFRIFRSIEELRTIENSIANSFISLFFTLLLLAMVVFTFSVLFLELSVDLLIQEHAHHEEMSFPMEPYFGGLGRTALTLFEAILGGLSWDVAIMAI